MRYSLAWLVLLLALGSSACVRLRVHKPVRGVDYLLPAGCILKPVELTGCDTSEPPHCKDVKVVYKRDCVQIKAK